MFKKKRLKRFFFSPFKTLDKLLQNKKEKHSFSLKRTKFFEKICCRTEKKKKKCQKEELTT